MLHAFDFRLRTENNCEEPFWSIKVLRVFIKTEPIVANF